MPSHKDEAPGFPLGPGAGSKKEEAPRAHRLSIFGTREGWASEGNVVGGKNVGFQLQRGCKWDKTERVAGRSDADAPHRNQISQRLKS